MEKLRYNSEIVDIDSLYYKLFNKFNDTSSESDKKIMADIIHTHKEAITKVKNNLSNPLKVKKREDYVFVIMHVHGNYPDNNFEEAIVKMPKGAIMVDIQDAGGYGQYNFSLDSMIIDMDQYHLLTGNTSKLDNRSDSLKLKKYIEKNTKIYNEDDYYPNLVVSFDPESQFHQPRIFLGFQGYGVILREYNKKDKKYESFHLNDKYKEDDSRRYNSQREEIQRLAKKFDYYAVGKRRINMKFFIEELKKIYKDKTVVFVPVSCRKFTRPRYIKSNATPYKYYLDFVTIFDQIYTIARKKFRDSMEKHLRYKTPESLLDLYTKETGEIKKDSKIDNKKKQDAFFKQKKQPRNEFNDTRK